MRSAFWLYLFMFIAVFDLHAQYPILTPFAISLGAAPSFIGYVMGVYSITHLPGNMVAGYGIDRFGGKWFVVVSLIFAGFLLLIQSYVDNPWELLMIRSISGFVLAFLSPACLTMLAKMAKDRVQQSKLMTGNGLVHTLASVVSPAAGAALVAKTGFMLAFQILGWGLVICGLIAIFFVKENKLKDAPYSAEILHLETASLKPLSQDDSVNRSISFLFFIIPIALSCSQGILFFEIPLALQHRTDMVMSTGILFSILSLGSLVTLSIWVLNKVAPLLRLTTGCICLALLFFSMAIDWPFTLTINLFLIGMAKGVIYPAIAAFLAEQSSNDRYGRNFAILSISYSIGAFLGPIIAGEVREMISPYFAAFISLMIGLILIPHKHNKQTWNLKPS